MSQTLLYSYALQDSQDPYHLIPILSLGHQRSGTYGTRRRESCSSQHYRMDCESNVSWGKDVATLIINGSHHSASMLLVEWCVE